MLGKNPTPVDVQNDEPIDVTLVENDEAKEKAASARVAADVLRTEDQRRISGIWERTQQIIALSVVLTTLAVSGIMVTTASVDQQNVAFVFLASVANLVIGFYFGRTNHSRSGGFDSRDA